MLFLRYLSSEELELELLLVTEEDDEELYSLL